MRYATFTNFDAEPFTAYWNGRPYTFQPGDRKEHLNESIASHFAKHLANKILTRTGKEQYCSPKKPLEVPEFMEVFNKAFSIEGEGAQFDAETGLPIDQTLRRATPDEVGMNVTVKPRQPIAETPHAAAAIMEGRKPAIPQTPEALAEAGIDPYDANALKQEGPSDKPQIIGTAVEGDDESSFEGA